MKKQINKINFGIGVLVLVVGLASCKKYLDARPDRSQVVPAGLQDLQALLDNVGVMNRSFPAYGEAAADNYYVTQTDYNALVIPQDKTLYIWQTDGEVVDGQWLAPYNVVFYANEVLESLGTIVGPADQAAQIKGAALYFRAYAFAQLAGTFTKGYNAQSAGTDPGIPLRLSADFNVKAGRGTNAQTYAQVVEDFKASLPLLPATSLYPSRPTKKAGYAALARTYLSMGDYTQAGLYADSCLALHPPLMDFNTLSATSANPIARFNGETLFYAMSSGSPLLLPSRCKLDSALYLSYAANDLRKVIFFKSNNNGTYAFKGNYDGAQSATIFSGLATDEIYLIAAECAARAGQTVQALGYLNTLLVTRYQKGTFQPLQAADAAAALVIILQERRKELVFRALRWVDLKRLNQDPAFKMTLLRQLGATLYQLPPMDLRYEFLIPQDVITLSGMAQNAR
jgi:hypothetical protein